MILVTVGTTTVHGVLWKKLVVKFTHCVNIVQNGPVNLHSAIIIYFLPTHIKVFP